MATTFRTEDEAIAADHAVFSFTGPHFHREFPRNADGSFTEETHLVTGKGAPYIDFVQIEVPCEGCWL